MREKACGGDNGPTKSCDKMSYISLKLIGIKQKRNSSLIIEQIESLGSRSICYMYYICNLIKKIKIIEKKRSILFHRNIKSEACYICILTYAVPKYKKLL